MSRKTKIILGVVGGIVATLAACMIFAVATYKPVTDADVKKDLMAHEWKVEMLLGVSELRFGDTKATITTDGGDKFDGSYTLTSKQGDRYITIKVPEGETIEAKITEDGSDKYKLALTKRGKDDQKYYDVKLVKKAGKH